MMKVEMFLTLLAFFAALTSLCVEAEKKLLANHKYSPNLLAVITAVVIGGGGTFIYYYLNAVTVGGVQIVYAILLGLASGLVSMVGYDKVQQLLAQMISK